MDRCAVLGHLSQTPISTQFGLTSIATTGWDAIPPIRRPKLAYRTTHTHLPLTFPKAGCAAPTAKRRGHGMADCWLGRKRPRYERVFHEEKTANAHRQGGVRGGGWDLVCLFFRSELFKGAGRICLIKQKRVAGVKGADQRILVFSASLESLWMRALPLLSELGGRSQVRVVDILEGRGTMSKADPVGKGPELQNSIATFCPFDSFCRAFLNGSLCFIGRAVVKFPGRLFLRPLPLSGFLRPSLLFFGVRDHGPGGRVFFHSGNLIHR